MNGCQLPCGSIIQVQPADSTYDKNIASATSPTHKKQKETAVVDEINPPPAPNDDQNEESMEDLDDFFASLA